jgi:ATP synthase proteolipid subunit
MGCASAIVLTTFGASYGTAKSSSAIFACGILRPDRLMQNTLCAVMAQILSIYGLVAAVIISGGIDERMAVYRGFMQLGAGVSVGLCGLAAGFAIGIVGDAGGKHTLPLLPPFYLFLSILLSMMANVQCSSCKHPAAKTLCRHGPHPHLRRSPRPLRRHRLYPHAHKVQQLPQLRLSPRLFRMSWCTSPPPGGVHHSRDGRLDVS